MNEKQFKRLRRLWHQDHKATLRMMSMRQGPALHLGERNKHRVMTLDGQGRDNPSMRNLPSGHA